MPPKLRPVSGEETIAALKRLGFSTVRQRGSHVVLQKQARDRNVGCVVPMHKELAIGTLRGILRQAEVSTEEFLQTCD